LAAGGVGFCTGAVADAAGCLASAPDPSVGPSTMGLSPANVFGDAGVGCDASKFVAAGFDVAGNGVSKDVSLLTLDDAVHVEQPLVPEYDVAPHTPELHPPELQLPELQLPDAHGLAHVAHEP
jgi:hypothetical protein